MRWTRGSIPDWGMNESEVLEIDDSDLRRRGMRESEPHELWELRVVELAVDERVRAAVGVRSRGELRA